MIAQINMLVCLVNDILDRKLIEMGSFSKKMEEFKPKQIFNFIEQMFASQAEMQGSSVSLFVV